MLDKVTNSNCGLHITEHKAVSGLLQKIPLGCSGSNQTVKIAGKEVALYRKIEFLYFQTGEKSYEKKI